MYKYNIDSYKLGNRYMNFMKKAFNFDKRIRKASTSEIENLVSVENGGTTKNIGTSEKQIEQIKKRMHKAFDIFISIEKNETKINKLLEQKKKIDRIRSSSDIMEIIDHSQIFIQSRI